MKYLVFGSLNIDRTYTVPHFVEAGETMSAAKMELFCGGKGFNQAVALARAGKEVYFAGAVGNDGGMLLEALAADGIHDQYIKRTNGASGHAVIQVDPKGQNCIIILPGANGEITEAELSAAKSAIISGLRSVPDSPRALESFYGTLFLCGRSDDLAARIAAVNAVTAEDVARCAGTVKLHTVFLLKGVGA